MGVLSDSCQNKCNCSQSQTQKKINEEKKKILCVNLIKSCAWLSVRGGRLVKWCRGWWPMMNPQIVPNKHALYLLHFPCTGPTEQALCGAARRGKLLTVSLPLSSRAVRTPSGCGRQEAPVCELLLI